MSQNRKIPANLNSYMSIKKSQAILKYFIDLKYSVLFNYAGFRRRNYVLWHPIRTFSAWLPVKVFKTLNGRQSHILSKFHKSKKFSRSELSWSISWSWSWSWSKQPVLWDFYIMFLLTRVQSMAWQATFDVITSWPFIRPPRKTRGKSLYASVPFWSWACFIITSTR